MRRWCAPTLPIRARGGRPLRTKFARTSTYHDNDEERDDERNSATPPFHHGGLRSTQSVARAYADGSVRSAEQHGIRRGDIAVALAAFLSVVYRRGAVARRGRDYPGVAHHAAGPPRQIITGPRRDGSIASLT